jgi:hypothetical protein
LFVPILRNFFGLVERCQLSGFEVAEKLFDLVRFDLLLVVGEVLALVVDLH